MKICMVTALDPSNTGIPKYTEGIVKGCRVSSSPLQLFLLVNKNAQQPEWVPNGIKVIRCWEEKIFYPFQVVSCVLKIRPNLVHVQHEFFLFGQVIEAMIFPLLIFLMRLFRYPIALTLHGVPVLGYVNQNLLEGFFLSRRTSTMRLLLRPFLKIICKLSSVVIVHCEFARNILIECYSVDSKKVHVIPHGINEFLCEGSSGETLRGDIIQLLFFGFVTPTKGVDDLIRAFIGIQDPSLRLLIVGGRHRRDDYYFRDILKLAERDQRITILGYAPDDLVSECFLKSDLVVLPYRYQLSASGALAMAIAYEKPLIVTNTPYFSEIIIDGYNGLFARVGDVSSLKSKIEMLAYNRRLLSQLKQGCKETKASLAWSQLVPELYSVYLKTITNSKMERKRLNFYRT